MVRNKHEKTAYEKLRKSYRAASPRHVITFETDLDENAKRHEVLGFL